AYRKVLVIDPNNETAHLNSVISRMSLNQPPDSCLTHLARIKASATPEVQFYFGKIYHLTSNFEQAINFYTRYKNIPAKLRTIPDEEVNYYISCSKNAMDLISQPHRSIIKNLGNTVNSPYGDYVPLIAPDESVLYFTSRREGSTGNLKDAYGNFYEDIYMSHKTEDGKWSTPKNLGSPINTNTHDACVALSFDGNQMIIYRTAADMVTGDLYLTRTDFDGWTVPAKLGSEINTPFIETSACFSTDTSVIYFSSNKPGGLGGKDIYRVKKLPNGRWSMPMNLGPTVNTERDDDAPFLHPDGVTLYFSSKGHNTMGEYDVFKTILNTETNTFSTPDNLGFPINTVNNDIFFVLNANGTHGYYSSVKEETVGGSDIYMIDTRFGDNDLKVKQGKVVFGNTPNKAKITLIDIESKQVSGIFNASSKTGKFILVMNPLKAYKAIIEEEGFQTMILDIEPLANELMDKELILSLTKKN
ncbi:MAG: PD40 domain-containing protein, partial [Bacteroidetes bacterium]|nr:PD40 domain-containing protein [Bacteroidota bacterium]